MSKKVNKKLVNIHRGVAGILTPLDIHNKEFRKGFRGYSETEVDEFLDEVVRDFETLIRENAELKSHLEEVEERLAHFKSIEETLNNTLIVAQSTAEELKASARKEADIIIREGELKAQKSLEEAQARVRRVQEEYEEIKKQFQVFRSKVRGLTQAYLNLLEEEEPENDDATRVAIR
ncbi:MAG: DivIVA domain-containing protein [Firmicutes bacterium]|nr:DivIVA domain-containing protein [Bacillota bacterium]MCL5040799.1 DivIVA domain-containing protein [Bacillota bacterium]